ncbi:hypothetical protein [Runella aurantiaca]|uniref:Uncharacterized protein n=1 Tax=Runella aurantiaca TaxID=2282308 RepID=A0A369HXN9_9BACT|nr:hypothetical protein [Runella aurantiaca]RDB02291.1 hypothetical protein DVG78_29500 [Runella aurantiaca]
MANLKTIVNKNDNEEHKGYMLPAIDQNGSLTGGAVNVGHYLPLVRWLISRHGVGQWKYLPNSPLYIRSQRLLLGLMLFTQLPDYWQNWREGVIKDMAEQFLYTTPDCLLNDPELPI